MLWWLTLKTKVYTLAYQAHPLALPHLLASLLPRPSSAPATLGSVLFCACQKCCQLRDFETSSPDNLQGKPLPPSSLCSDAPLVRPTLNILIKMTLSPSPESPYPALYHFFSHSTHHLLTCYTYIYMLFLLLYLLTHSAACRIFIFFTDT